MTKINILRMTALKKSQYASVGNCSSCGQEYEQCRFCSTPPPPSVSTAFMEMFTKIQNCLSMTEGISPLFSVLYTNQKTKKKKVFQDGVLHCVSAHKAKLFAVDEDGGIGDLLESINIKKGIEIDIGTSFESPRHIIEVDCIFSNSSAENLNSNEKEKQANVENIGLKKRPFSKISKSSSKVEENLIPEEKKADIQEEVYQEEIRYSVMYTKQKTKKSKIWHDGILKLRHGVHASFYSRDEEDLKLTLLCEKKLSGQMPKPGDIIEISTFLFEILEIISNDNDQREEASAKVNILVHKPKKSGLGSKNARGFKLLHARVDEKSSELLKKSRISNKVTKDSNEWISAANCNWKKNGGPFENFVFLSPYEALRLKFELEKSFSYTIPDTFDSIDAYRLAFVKALQAEIIGMLSSAASSFASCFFRSDFLDTSHPALYNYPFCAKHGPYVMKRVLKKGVNFGKLYLSCSCSGCSGFQWSSEITPSSRKSTCYQPNKVRDRVAFFRSFGVGFYEEITLQGRYFTGSMKFFLQLGNTQEKVGNYGKDDIWVISRKFDFCSGGPNETILENFVGVFKSLFFSPGKNTQMLEVEPLELRNDIIRLKEDFDTTIFAIRCCNASDKLFLLNFLNSSLISEESFLLKCIVFGKKYATEENYKAEYHAENNFPVIEIGTVDLSRHIEIVQKEFRLNEEQLRLLHNTGNWFVKCKKSDSSQYADRIQLVHGVFGSGKSHTIVALIIFLSNLFKEFDLRSKLRILVSAVTNVAVDRILMELLEFGFEDFIRVGSVKKIAKPILKHSLHSGEKGDEEAKNALKELREMLSSAKTSERKSILDAIKSYEDERIELRKQRLSSVSVVGVTCAAATFPVLENNTFPILILDESSQIIEPRSLFPILKFNVSALVAVGDPLQLPPTLSLSTANQDNSNDLTKTLFTRLSNAGWSPLLLKTQYRCHPKISDVSNRLFYQNRLVNGVGEASRRPIIPGLNPLEFIHVPGHEKLVSGGSFENEMECRTIMRILHGIEEMVGKEASIGIITLYKAQADKLKGMLLDRDKFVKRLSSSCGENENDHVDESEESEDENSDEEELFSRLQISTVDAFQGAERDIMLLSCCRTKFIGFTDTPQRLNVAITRAKYHLIVFGHRPTLEKSDTWSEIIKSCHRRESAQAFIDEINLAVVENVLSSEESYAGIEDESRADEFHSEHDEDLEIVTPDIRETIPESKSCQLAVDKADDITALDVDLDFDL